MKRQVKSRINSKAEQVPLSREICSALLCYLPGLPPELPGPPVFPALPLLYMLEVIVKEVIVVPPEIVVFCAKPVSSQLAIVPPMTME